MHEKTKTTKIGGGRPFNERFFNDLTMLRGLPLKKQIELVDRILEWVPDDGDTTWKKWTKIS